MSLLCSSKVVGSWRWRVRLKRPTSALVHCSVFYHTGLRLAGEEHMAPIVPRGGLMLRYYGVRKRRTCPCAEEHVISDWQAEMIC